MMDILEKLAARDMSSERRREYWQRITVVVDRAMCEDCIRPSGDAGVPVFQCASSSAFIIANAQASDIAQNGSQSLSNCFRQALLLEEPAKCAFTP
ncbi:hypothetical protein ON010_g6305 [Phytophthora cinnamomi]|nr:hypothetical protein ON010_g6305 [Phytophthora cinnamomi]